MPRALNRVIAACEVEFSCGDDLVLGITQDLSPAGLFVRTDRILPVGDVCEVWLHLPAGTVVHSAARVVHVLSVTEAKSLARPAGMGMELLEGESAACAPLRGFLEELSGRLVPPPGEAPMHERVLVADGSARLRRRLVTALRNAGCAVEAAADGEEALALSRVQPPALLVADAELPKIDGFSLIGALGREPALAKIPVILMSEDASDLTRLRALRLGAMELVPKPFTIAELCIRVRRLLRSQRAQRELVVLRGRIAEIAVGTLLSLLELERKSGVLAVMHETEVAWISLANGTIVAIDGTSAQGDLMTSLLSVLDWANGDFEFTACEILPGNRENVPVTALLLEHARRADEAGR